MIIKYNVRGFDAQGAGHYGAPRGNRTHTGIDFVCDTHERIMAFQAGKVTKIGYPYNPNDKRGRGLFRYVQVTDYRGNNLRYFYIQPLVQVGDIIRKNQVIGLSQALAPFYPGITQHFHFELKTGRKFFDPTKYIRYV